MFQQQLLDRLKTELPPNTSLNEAVSAALDISYDAAHRRTTGKSKFSLDESVLLAKYYDLSLDRLFENTKQEIIAVEKTKAIHNEVDLQDYFENSYQSLYPLLNQKESSILYSAKDIPLFYTLENDLLSRFKIYVWLKLLDSEMVSKPFDGFSLRLSTIQSASKLGNLYQNLKITEIWDVTTINSTLKQIHFYNQAALLSNADALQLCLDLKILIKKISKKISPNNNQYSLYYNELLLMNNNVLVTTPKGQSLFVPFTILSYFQSTDKNTCHQAIDFLNKQLQSSKLLNTSGEKEQQNFFNKIYSKINALYQLIEATQILDYE